MKTILAEKPSVAKDIARVLGANEKKDGYLEGNGWRVTWAFGHLVALAVPSAYDEKFGRWNTEDLPIVPDEFLYVASSDAGARKQLKIIRTLFESATEIVCATDAGREGEAIFRYIYNETDCKKPFKRLWISSLTDSAIRDGFASLKPGSEYDNLYLSAKARNEADWIVGLNATRALTLASHSPKPLSLGRVQTPTLSIVCERFIANRDFKPTTFFTVVAKLDGGGSSFIARYPVRFDVKGDASAVASAIRNSSMVVVDKKEQDKTEKAPLPFDITSIQAEANKRFGFKAQKTLDIVQTLYETHKMLTYPRTGSRYLGDDMVDEVRRNISSLSSLSFSPSFREAVYSFTKGDINTACFNSAKLTDHHAIIPTFHNIDKFSSLSDDEKKIYMLATVQLVLALMPVCKKECLSYRFDAGQKELFEASGFKITQPGWRMLYDEKKDGEDDEQEENQILPSLNKGDEIISFGGLVKEGQTKRPPLLTEATLLKAMETAGKTVDDDELAKAMRDCGLGTPATRAAVIETLYKRGYMFSSANKITPTELGLNVYNLIKSYAIGSASMTGEWEYKLNLVAEGKFDVKEFMDGIIGFVGEEVERIKKGGGNVGVDEMNGLVCPLCGRPLTQNSKAFGCTGYKDGCKFVVWKTQAGKPITIKHLKQIVEEGETFLIKGFRTKDGKTFDASLRWSKDENRVVYAFEGKEKMNLGKCPVCGSDVLEGEKGYYCSGYKQGCNFGIFKQIRGKNIDEKTAISLLENGRSSLIKGFKSKDGKAYNAFLVIKDGGVALEFEKKK